MIRTISAAFLTLFVFELSDVIFAAEPAGLPPVVHPKDNPPTDEKIALGKQLFFDGRLSADNKVACATCHDPAKGFSNGEQFATGVEGKKGGRNSPTVINAALQQFQFWDGRAKSLEELVSWWAIRLRYSAGRRGTGGIPQGCFPTRRQPLSPATRTALPAASRR